jgi:molybdopterin synthase catalytic subunit
MSAIARLVHRPIDVAALTGEVASTACGATTVFLGTVREVNEGRAVSGIDYNSYERMAASELQAIADEVATHHPGVRIVVEHRLGFLELGETSVGIAAAHPRRAASMDAARTVIEEIKKRVPIWKREHYVDGTREWVDPTRSRATVAGEP